MILARLQSARNLLVEIPPLQTDHRAAWLQDFPGITAELVERCYLS